MTLFKMKYDLGDSTQALEITLDKSWIMFEIISREGKISSASICREHFDAFVAAYKSQKFKDL